MRDRFINLRKPRAATSHADLMESPTAVLVVLAASAIVCATILILLVTRLAPVARIEPVEDRPIEIRIADIGLGTVAIPPAASGAPTTGFDAPARLELAALPPMEAESDYVMPAPNTWVEPEPTIISGRPPVEAQPRPDHIEHLAASIRNLTNPANVLAARPAQRPTVAEAPEGGIVLASSLRPTLRPANLEVAPTLAVAVASTPDVPVTLATATPEVSTAPAFDRNANACSTRLSRAIPRRPGNAAGGTPFIQTLASASGTTRDAAIAREVLRGNVPDFLRDLAPVSFTGVLPNGRSAQITICVTPDYLAVGSDRDFVRVPLGLSAAGQIAEAFDMMLPTTRIVDAIYAQADLRLSPSPMDPTSQMASTNYFLRHNATVEAQRANAGGRLGMLVSGQKKDLVLTNRLARAPGRVAIYGWHRPGGNPIQPLSTVHGAAYADYSHGIRLVSRTAFVNGQAVDLEDLLMDGTYAGLLNTDGPIGRPAIQLASR
ncbi:MAG: hypothetical protein CL945_15860 [Dinoroseobacter sp.]|jgi:hypothetical protein|nr:hypothetical protein [Dinoroseobacter sp.]